MSFEEWLNYLRSAEKKSIINGKTRRIFYKFADGKQMAEEYSMDTGVVQRRAWCKSKQLMGDPEWETELGETPYQLGASINGIEENDNSFTLKESNTEPIISKRITKRNIEWRIRNLPYPVSVYSVQAGPEKYCLTVRTTNKKYYKVIEVPELARCKISSNQANISIHHQFNTLIITYTKPDILCEMEAAVLLLLKDVETETDMEDLMKDLLSK